MTLEEFVPAQYSLRPIRIWVNEALTQLHGKFSAMYEADVKSGRPCIAPEKLMRAMLLQVLDGATPEFGGFRAHRCGRPTRTTEHKDYPGAHVSCAH